MPLMGGRFMKDPLMPSNQQTRFLITQPRLLHAKGVGLWQVTRRLHSVVLSALAAAIILPSVATAQDITGAGATFPAPIYARWAADYNKITNVKVNYQSVGSGAGIKQIDAKTVTFGASDMPLKDDELSAKGLFQFPTVIGGVVPVVNLTGVKPGQMKLTGEVLADIYLGKIKKWNEAPIASLNPGVTLPDADIQVVRRSDGSGTTFIFASYLSDVSPEWKSKVGAGTALNWPVGAGGKGNEGVAAFVSRLPGSIGYVEYAYVKQNHMNYVLVKNAAGAFVAPNDTSFKAAAAGADWKKSFYQILVNQPGKDAWPISGVTYILMYLKNDKGDEAAQALKFFDWAYKNGDASADSLDYVPLPLSVKDMVRARWNGVSDGSGKALVWK